MSIFDQIEQTHRELSGRDAEIAVILTKEFNASPDEVWAACTDPNQLPRWFEPVSGELREGGRYQLDGSGSIGVIETCVRPSRLSVTWEFAGESSRVDVSIAETHGRATVRLAHLVPVDDHWRTFGPGATGVGWDSAFLALSFYLAGDPRAEPAAMEQLSATPNGIEFVRLSAQAWQAAHIASGADPERARLAAGQTIAAYTGIEEPS